MSQDCNIPNPLVRDGTSQSQRMLSALDPANNPIDDRSILDLIRFMKAFASEVTYYDIKNEASGTWAAFFDSDVIASISEMDSLSVSSWNEVLETLLDTLLDGATPTTELRKSLKACYDLLFTGYYMLDSWYAKVPEETKVHQYVSRLITAQARKDLLEVIKSFKAAGQSPTLLASFDWSGTQLKVLDANMDYVAKFNNIWSPESSKDWEIYYGEISADDTLFGSDRSNVDQSIANGAVFLKGYASRLVSVFVQLQAKSDAFLEDILANHSAHEPHMALLLTFLQLFRNNQEQLNSITQKHLDFYYGEALALSKQAPVSDQVHLLFELANARSLSSHLLPEGTAFKAGKDEEGNNIIYTLDHDLVVNRAKVQSLKSVYIDRENGDQLYDAPVANSLDGIGEEELPESESWSGFGGAVVNSEMHPHMQQSAIGFMIQSRSLLLQEGRRIIDVQLDCDRIDEAFKSGFTILLSTAEGWLEKTVHFTEEKPEDESEGTKSTVAVDGSSLFIQVVLEAIDEPVTEVSTEVHELMVETTLPAMKIICDVPSEGAYGYQWLKNSRLEAVNLTVRASLSDLTLQNDGSLIDPSAPFYPFGTQPFVGTSFILGSRELMSKDLSNVSIAFDWINAPTDFESHYANYGLSDDEAIENGSFGVAVKQLKDRSWQVLQTDLALFTDLDATGRFDKELLLDGSSVENDWIDEELELYEAGQRRGFLKLELSSPSIAFGHSVFPQRYTNTTLEDLSVDGEITSENLPKEPYTPFAKDFVLSYTARETIDLSKNDEAEFTARRARCYHVEPFGVKEIHSVLQDEVYFLPQYTHEESGEGWLQHQGLCYIGLSDVSPLEGITLWVQVDEGSEDPEADTPVLYWSYLSENEWVPFKSNEILEDSTNGFLQTGILKFELPKTISQSNTIMPSGQYWLKAAITESPQGVCKIISISTQVATATFQDNANASSILDEPLEAETISKTVFRTSSIGSIMQPEASFGGKPEESDPAFYQRVSERLRHKNRSLTIWDYERMVLQQFPELYKVKTINHSTYSNALTSEFAPGYVSVVVIPDTSIRKVVDPFQPKVSKAKLLSISDFLASKMSPWAANTLQVLNPSYEEIQVSFEVAFSEADRGYYELKLNEDLKAFLAPWTASDQSDGVNSLNISFGGSLHKSVILNYVEERTYVDYVKYFKMNQYVDKELYLKDIEEAYPTTARSIFTSINRNESSEEHQILEIS